MSSLPPQPGFYGGGDRCSNGGDDSPSRGRLPKASSTANRGGQQLRFDKTRRRVSEEVKAVLGESASRSSSNSFASGVAGARVNVPDSIDENAELPDLTIPLSDDDEMDVETPSTPNGRARDPRTSNPVTPTDRIRGPADAMTPRTRQVSDAFAGMKVSSYPRKFKHGPVGGVYNPFQRPDAPGQPPQSTVSSQSTTDWRSDGTTATTPADSMRSQRRWPDPRWTLQEDNHLLRQLERYENDPRNAPFARHARIPGGVINIVSKMGRDAWESGDRGKAMTLPQRSKGLPMSDLPNFSRMSGPANRGWAHDMTATRARLVLLVDRRGPDLIERTRVNLTVRADRRATGLRDHGSHRIFCADQTESLRRPRLPQRMSSFLANGPWKRPVLPYDLRHLVEDFPGHNVGPPRQIESPARIPISQLSTGPTGFAFLDSQLRQLENPVPVVSIIPDVPPVGPPPPAPVRVNQIRPWITDRDYVPRPHLARSDSPPPRLAPPAEIAGGSSFSKSRKRQAPSQMENEDVVHRQPIHRRPSLMARNIFDESGASVNDSAIGGGLNFGGALPSVGEVEERGRFSAAIDPVANDDSSNMEELEDINRAMEAAVTIEIAGGDPSAVDSLASLSAPGQMMTPEEESAFYEPLYADMGKVMVERKRKRQQGEDGDSSTRKR